MNTNRLTWTAATPGDAPIAGYRLYNADNNELIFDSLSPSVLTYDHADRPVGTYRYYVTAYDSDGLIGPASNTIELVVEDSGDPSFPSVVTLLTGDTGAIVEWSGGTTVSVMGTCALSASQVKFGSRSIRNPDSDTPVDATDGIVITDAVITDRFTFPGEFTMEGWFYPVDATTDADQSMLIGNDATNGAQRFVLDVRTDVGLGDQGRIRFLHGGAVVVQSAGGVVLEGQWQHIAVTRDALGIVRLFHQGVVVGTSAAYVNTIGGVDSLGRANLKVTIGIAFVVGDLDTYFDQIRITDGVCRYSANFTPPTEPFPKS